MTTRLERPPELLTSSLLRKMQLLNDGDLPMKAFLLGCGAAVVIAIAAMAILDQVQEPVAQAFATTGVRL